jgi:hemerythrin-like domain-containing protein
MTTEQFRRQLGLPLTVERVKRCVQYIRDVQGDDEVAHAREDELHRAVLAHVASGFDGTAVAAAAVKTTKLKFSRWCS